MDKYKIFFDAVLKGGARPIVEAAYQYFQRPITVIDVAYRLICQLPDQPVSDVVFDAILGNNGTPEDIVRLLEVSKYRDYLADHPHATFVDWGNLKDPRIMGTMRIGAKTAGYYAILYKEGTPTDEDLAIAQIFSDAISADIKRQERFYLRKDELGSVIMRDITSENATSETILSWSRNSQSLSKVGYQIICARASSINASARLEYICRSIDEKFTDCCFSIVKNDKIYILFYNLGREKARAASSGDKIVNDVVKLLNSYHIVCGLSNRFIDVALIPEHRYMAEDMLSICTVDANQMAYPFQQYAFQSMIDKINQTRHPSAYIHPTLKKLFDYDKEYSTNFAETLKLYIVSFKDLASTSAKLNIHRNTLKYRLQKISDISELDYNNDVLCAQLLINFYMLAFQEQESGTAADE